MRYVRQRYEASRTAQWVAAARTFGGQLPEELVLAEDPYGLSFSDGAASRVATALLRHPRLLRSTLAHAGPLTSFLLWMQLRTRALDDVLLEFVRAGGRQVVLLGAGYDSRAARFARELGDTTVFEVDHPATQAVKRARLPAGVRGRVVYVSWDFERDPMAELPARLAELSLAARAKVLTIWEGVTMYLSPEAIDATVRALRGLGGAGSRLALTYIDRTAIERRARADLEHGLFQRLVATVGEPWRFGWHPAELAGWFEARGFVLVSDVTDGELARRFFPARQQRRFARENRHIAVVEVRDGR